MNNKLKESIKNITNDKDRKKTERKKQLKKRKLLKKRNSKIGTNKKRMCRTERKIFFKKGSYLIIIPRYFIFFFLDWLFFRRPSTGDSWISWSEPVELTDFLYCLVSRCFFVKRKYVEGTVFHNKFSLWIKWQRQRASNKCLLSMMTKNTSKTLNLKDWDGD